MHKLGLILMCVGLLVGLTQIANAQQYRYEMRPLSSIGKVTGGKCNTHKECVNGYLPKGSKFAMLCLTRKQAGSRLVGDNHVPANGLTCGCLPDVHYCGYAEPQYISR